jgi:GAF domain-containing protein
MEAKKKEGRYSRIYDQLVPLMEKCHVPEARMATIVAVLHHKMDYFFWTGFYLLRDGELVVNNYQGQVACQVLEKHKGVCWAGVDRKETVLVEDVEAFPGHIACDSRSKSEIVLPLYDAEKELIGVLDVDSKDEASFDEIDAKWLEKILDLIYS